MCSGLKVCSTSQPSQTLYLATDALAPPGVGKTSLVQRFVKGTFTPPTTLSTIGASFLTKRAIDPDSGTAVRLQVWDTAGQERFRSISKLYYRGASAVILVYSILDEQSFVEMGRWLQEIKENCGEEVIVHVVGTKSDIVAQNPAARKIPFERCIAYVAENLYSREASTPPGSGSGKVEDGSKRNSGFWGQDAGWDVCHEISASSGEGIDEVFRVITRKLVEKKQKKFVQEQAAESSAAAAEISGSGYFDRPGADNTGSFRLGIGDRNNRRKSWLGFPTPTFLGEEEQVISTVAGSKQTKGGRCC